MFSEVDCDKVEDWKGSEISMSELVSLEEGGKTVGVKVFLA